MANVPSWFNGSVYMQNKLASLKATDSTMTYDKMLAAFTEAGFIGEEGYYQHFEQYGSKAAENLSPNAFFDPYEYAQFKAISYFTSDEAGDKKVDEATVRGDIKYYAGQITQAFSDAGMSAWEHYNQYGAAEKINTSNAFDESDYLTAKAAALNKAEGVDTWTADTVRDAIIKAGMTPLSHYMEYAGKGDNEVKAGSTFAVPDDEKVKEGSSSGDDSTGENKAFTSAVGETIEGTAGDDTFTGVLAFNAGAYDGVNSTFNLGDTGDGKAGTDTFKLTLTGGDGSGTLDAPAGATVKNIEVVNLVHTDDNEAAGNLLNSATYEGIKELWQTDNDGAAAGTFMDVTVEDGVKVGYRSNGVAADGTGPAVAVATATITASATQTSLAVELDGVGSTSTVEVAAGAAKLATIDITGSVANAAAGAAGVLNVKVGPAAAAVKTLNFGLESKTDVRLADGLWDTTIETVDFGASTGSITFDYTGLTAANMAPITTLNGGGAADALTAIAFVDGKDVKIDAGAGDDTVTINANSAAAAKGGTGTITLGAGKDTLEVAAGYKDLYEVDTAANLQKTMTTVSDFNKAEDTLNIKAAATTGNFVAFTTTQLSEIAGKDDLLAAAKAAEALTDGSKIQEALFNYGSDMYVLITDGTDNFSAADALIKIAGVQTTDMVEGLNGNFVHA